MLENLIKEIIRANLEVIAFSERTITVLREGVPLTIPATYDEVCEVLGY